MENRSFFNDVNENLSFHPGFFPDSIPRLYVNTVFPSINLTNPSAWPVSSSGYAGIIIIVHSSNFSSSSIIFDFSRLLLSVNILSVIITLSFHLTILPPSRIISENVISKSLRNMFFL